MVSSTLWVLPATTIQCLLPRLCGRAIPPGHAQHRANGLQTEQQVYTDACPGFRCRDVNGDGIPDLVVCAPAMEMPAGPSPTCWPITCWGTGRYLPGACSIWRQFVRCSPTNVTLGQFNGTVIDIAVIDGIDGYLQSSARLASWQSARAAGGVRHLEWYVQTAAPPTSTRMA